MPKRKVATIADDCCPSVLAAPLDDQAATELARGFAALADPVRLRLLSILAAAETGEVCACDFIGPLDRSQPTVSHHLKVLADAGLVTGDKRGRWVWYRLVPERFDALRSALSTSQPNLA
jgi:DNA-binding transcriptional ArsR family regulator